MDPPPPHSTTMHLNYPDSSPCSHDTTFTDPLPPIPGAKLRVMCSYGGHIIPRPHDKSLCYVGGETRMIVVDRNSSLSCVVTRLSRSLLDGRPFTIKYQLPNEDLDSLVSVTTDEDLDNMIEEYDRINVSSCSGLGPSRIRLFLFLGKPETSASMGSLLDDAKSETWFVDALNGSLLPRNLSESAAVECLVNMEDLESPAAEGGGGEMMKNNVAVENGTSSFGSSSSSPTMSNLPPIRVRVDHQDQRVIMEEQFAKMSFAQVVVQNNNGGAAALPPLPTSIIPVGMVVAPPPLNPSGGSSDNLNRVSSDEERSDQGVAVNFRKKPPLPLQSVQLRPAAGGSPNYSLPSPDSVASDSSAASVGNNPLSKMMYYQEQNNNTETKTDQIPQIQMQQQPQNPPYGQYDQQQQQQYIQTNTHYMPHPVSSYYPIYQTQQTPNINQTIDQQHQQQQQQQQQQYPVYVMPVPQTQQYMSVHPNNNVNSSTHPHLYSTPEAAAASGASVYRTSVPPPPNPTLVPISGTQYQQQQQYVSYAQMQQHPSQALQSTSVAPGGSGGYGYEYGQGTQQEQVYYTQVQAAAPAAQYQTMTAAAVVALADASSPMSNTMQPMGTPQQL